MRSLKNITSRLAGPTLALLLVGSSAEAANGVKEEKGWQLWGVPLQQLVRTSLVAHTLFSRHPTNEVYYLPDCNIVSFVDPTSRKAESGKLDETSALEFENYIRDEWVTDEDNPCSKGYCEYAVNPPIDDCDFKKIGGDSKRSTYFYIIYIKNEAGGIININGEGSTSSRTIQVVQRDNTEPDPVRTGTVEKPVVITDPIRLKKFTWTMESSLMMINLAANKDIATEIHDETLALSRIYGQSAQSADYKFPDRQQWSLSPYVGACIGITSNERTKGTFNFGGFIIPINLESRLEVDFPSRTNSLFSWEYDYTSKSMLFNGGFGISTIAGNNAVIEAEAGGVLSVNTFTYDIRKVSGTLPDGSQFNEFHDDGTVSEPGFYLKGNLRFVPTGSHAGIGIGAEYLAISSKDNIAGQKGIFIPYLSFKYPM